MKRAQGYTIVEMMIAITLGMMVTAGVAAVLVSSSTLFRSSDTRAQIQQGARFALSLLEEDVRLAGYMGCYNRHLFANLTNRVTLPDAFNHRYTVPITGFEASNDKWVPVIETSIGSKGTHPPVAGTDVLVVRAPIGASLALAEDMPSPAAPLKLERTDKLENGSLAVVSDCNVADIFRVTGDPSGSLALHTDAHNSSTELSKKYQALRNTLVTPLGTMSYFVAASGSAVAGERSLWRQVDGDTPEEAVEGVHDFQVEYGLDVNKDLAADQFVRADVLTATSSIVAVRLTMLLRSQSNNVVTTPLSYIFNGAAATAADRRVYTPFTTTIHVRNQVK